VAKRKQLSPEQELKKLQRDWYKKLKRDGFQDIEQPDGNLKVWSQSLNNDRHLGRHTSRRQAHAEYYYYANQWLNEGKFDLRLDKIIWEYHSNGISMRGISKLLKQTKVCILSRTSVYNIIKDIRQKMFRAYSIHSGKINEQ
jgi:hypothetical protein